MVKSWMLELQTEAKLGWKKDHIWCCHMDFLRVAMTKYLESAVSGTDDGIRKIPDGEVMGITYGAADRTKIGGH